MSLPGSHILTEHASERLAFCIGHEARPGDRQGGSDVAQGGAGQDVSGRDAERCAPRRPRQLSTRSARGSAHPSRRHAKAREGTTHDRRTTHYTHQTETEPGSDTLMHRSSCRLMSVVEQTGTGWDSLSDRHLLEVCQTECHEMVLRHLETRFFLASADVAP